MVWSDESDREWLTEEAVRAAAGLLADPRSGVGRA